MKTQEQKKMVKVAYDSIEKALSKAQHSLSDEAEKKIMTFGVDLIVASPEGQALFRDVDRMATFYGHVIDDPTIWDVDEKRQAFRAMLLHQFRTRLGRLIGRRPFHHDEILWSSDIGMALATYQEAVREEEKRKRKDLEALREKITAAYRQLTPSTFLTFLRRHGLANIYQPMAADEQLMVLLSPEEKEKVGGMLRDNES